MATGPADQADAAGRIAADRDDRAELCQAPGSDRSPDGAGMGDGLDGGEIRGGGAVLESSGSFTW